MWPYEMTCSAARSPSGAPDEEAPVGWVPVFGAVNETPGGGMSEDFVAYLFNNEYSPKPEVITEASVALPPIPDLASQPFRERTQWLDFGETAVSSSWHDFSCEHSRSGLGQHEDPTAGPDEPDICAMLSTSQLGERNVGKQDEMVFADSGYGSAPKLKIPPILGGTHHLSEGVDIEDSQTLCSTATTVATAYAKRYVTDLAQDIYARLGDILPNEDRSIQLGSVPELVKAFAVRLAHDFSLLANREIMYIVHKRHQEIAAQLQDFILHGTGVHHEVGQKEPHKMSLCEKIALWNSKAGDMELERVLDDELFQGIGDDMDEVDDESCDDGDMDAAKLMGKAKLPVYNAIIAESPAYKWFISNLRKECGFHWHDSQPRTMVDDIRKPILARLPAGTISKKRAPRPHWAEFRILRPSLESWLSNTIAITGTSGHAQVATVGEYFRQTWPSSGPEFLPVLESAIHNPAAGWQSGTLPDKSHVIARIYQSWLLVMIIGPAYSIAECGEQLAWLAAALHPPTNNDSDVYTIPSLVVTEIHDGTHPAQHVLKDRGLEKQKSPTNARDKPSRLTRFDIEVAESPVTSSDTPGEKPRASVFGKGTGYVFAQGFPIARRPGNCPGLELSFRALLSLTGPQRTTNIHGVFRLETSRVNLQLVNKKGDTFFWHNFLGIDQQPQCVSHDFIGSDPLPRWTGLVESDFMNGRHILCGYTCQPHSATLSASKHNHECVLATSLSPTGSTSLDTELLSIPSNSEILGEETESKSPGFHLFKRVSRRLFLECYRADVNQLPNSHGNNGTANNQSHYNHQAQTQTPYTASQSPSSQWPQHPQKRQPDGHGDDDQDQPKRKRPKTHQPTNPRQRCYLSCPFWKLNSEKHWECFFKKTTTVSYVKQHLARRHTPTFYCHRCFAIFDMHLTYDQHVLAASCTRGSTATLDGISHAQSRQLSRRTRGSPEEQWFAMWDILFPGEPRPLSIYIDSDLSEDLCRVREFGQRRGVAILREELRGSGLLLHPGVSEGELGHVLRRGLDAIFEQFSSLDRGSVTGNSPSSSSLALLDSTTSQHGGSSRVSGLAELSVFSSVSQPSSNTDSRTGEAGSIDMIRGRSWGRAGDEADADAVDQERLGNHPSGDLNWERWNEDDGCGSPSAGACGQLDFDELLRGITT